MPAPNTKCVICSKKIYRIPSRLHSWNTCSIACRNKWFSKEKHPKWIGGKPVYLQNTRIRDKERRLKYKEKAVALLGGKCAHCDYDKCIAALDFHHTDPLSKNDTVRDIISGGWKRIEEEIKKCILLCSNCHREHHWKEKHG